jgi:hypothetical protein
MADKTKVQQTIIDELGLSELPQEKQEQLLIKMTEVVLNRIFDQTMEKLGNEDQEKYEQMLNQNATAEEMEAFLREKITDYDQMVLGIIENFKEEMKKVE